MPPLRNKSKSNRAAGHLLLLGCSDRKVIGRGRLPALELYDGVNFRVLRTFLNKQGWPPGLIIKVLSAKYGLIDATKLIAPYDQRLDLATAIKLRPKVLQELRRAGNLKSVFVNLGRDYLTAVQGINGFFLRKRITYAEGGIGLKMAHMKSWLHELPSKTATLPGCKENRSYLYFFPDWDDYVKVPFIHEVVEEQSNTKTKKRYAHEVFGAANTPYDGMLVSLAQIENGKGALSRLDAENSKRTDLRKAMRMPKRLLLFGDCGAFSYVNEDSPPLSVETAARLYHRFGFDVGASVDHIPLPEIVTKDEEGIVIRRALSIEERQNRMRLTARNAVDFFEVCRNHRYRFVPIGVIQGLDTASYVKYVDQYIDIGYRHIALGGLVPKQDDEILEICCAVRRALQKRTRTVKENVWLHLFGILRPKLQAAFRVLGVSSFDSASYLRKAWLRSDQNYLSADGESWYSTIRVPLSSTKRLVDSAKKEKITEDQLREREHRCLVALNNFNGTKKTHDEVMNAVNNYGPLLERRGEDNHFLEKHNEVLTHRPWEKCRCSVCREMGIDVVVFRGTGRNKRRGFHNTWVLYNKILHGK
jgi:hypothetical protein